MIKKFGYRIEIFREFINESYDDKSEGDWSEEWAQTFEGAFINDNIPDLASALEIKEGEKCFVVWASWSPGDSFGRSDNRNTEALGIFKDSESAAELEKAVDEASWGRETGVRFVSLRTKDGQSFEMNLPWTGMDSLGALHVEETTMGIDLPRKRDREIG